MAAFAAVGMAVLSGAASAGPVESDVKRNTPAGLWPILAYGEDDCASYPIRDLKITVQPRHGIAGFVKAPFTLDEATGLCKGTRIEVPWLVYKPAKDYVGSDTVSISWNKTSYTNDTHVTYMTKDFAITIK
ncbi:hypothetical protein [Labrys monachus]|uniref:Uncharacterized protein n=1 Tax=Labrys monachus TaxID=217067 RepID=A0ABU0FBG0_9HYPH|nr:hypothetical protein [Labrys monachus]MDQ0391771.1 hypothetical protein [Labrys monachus]